MNRWGNIVAFAAMVPFVVRGVGPRIAEDLDCFDEGYIHNCVEFYIEHGMCNIDSEELDTQSVNNMNEQYPEECTLCENIQEHLDHECIPFRPSGRSMEEDSARNTGFRYIKIDRPNQDEEDEFKVLNLGEVRAFDEDGNLIRAVNWEASSIKRGKGPERCNDSSADEYCQTDSRDQSPFFKFGYQHDVDIKKIEIVNRADCCQDRIVGARVALYYNEDIAWEAYFEEEKAIYEFDVDEDPTNVALPEETEEQKTYLEQFKDLMVKFGLEKFGEDGEPEFCWRGAKGRTVGTLGSECPPGKERVGLAGLFCYDNCPLGFSRKKTKSGTPIDANCYQDCPEGWRDWLQWCEYYKMPEKGYTRHQMCKNPFRKPHKERCEESYGEGNCEQSSGNWCWAPKCSEPTNDEFVYYKGSGISCKPTVDCESLGMINGFQVTGKKCTKQPPKLWPGIANTGCPEGTERSGALCYPKCEEGYEGVGPVCWAPKPKGWVWCGFGAAKDTSTCLSQTKDQVMAVGTLVSTIVSLGQSITASAAGGAASKTPGLVKKGKELYDWIKKIKDGSGSGQKLMKAVTKAAGVYNDMDTFATTEDIVRFVFKMTALFDKTGISDTVAAFTYPECSKYNIKDDDDDENDGDNDDNDDGNDDGNDDDGNDDDGNDDDDDDSSSSSSSDDIRDAIEDLRDQLEE